MKRVLLVVVLLSACAHRDATMTRIGLLEGKVEANDEGMLSRETCNRLCPPRGEIRVSTCSPAELVTDHPDEQIVACGERAFRFQELPEDVNPNEPTFSGPACVRICGAAHTGGCHLVRQVPIVEGKRFVVCRYQTASR